MIRQITHADVTQEMVDILYRSYLRENKTARECVLRILNLHDGVKANEEGAHTEATSGQIHAINNLFLIKGWSATCAIQKIIQDMENIRG